MASSKFILTPTVERLKNDHAFSLPDLLSSAIDNSTAIRAKLMFKILDCLLGRDDLDPNTCILDLISLLSLKYDLGRDHLDPNLSSSLALGSKSSRPNSTVMLGQADFFPYPNLLRIALGRDDLDPRPTIESDLGRDDLNPRPTRESDMGRDDLNPSTFWPRRSRSGT